MNARPATPLQLFLCGDVMTGRGIDQILPFPSEPTLHESYVRDARHYVTLAEEANGKIPRAADWNYIWGDALSAINQADTRIINLETSVTCCDDYWPGKGIHYRMHPENIRCLTAAGIDCCCLANNHILDWGYEGLTETLRTLDEAGIAHAGAGRDAIRAAAPAVLDPVGNTRVLVFAYGMTTSGIPAQWKASKHRPGVNLLDDCSDKTAHRIARKMTDTARPGDLIVTSIHWGPNWGYEISAQETNFARCLIDGGVHLVHGHSAHHLKPLEVHDGRLVLYGCGDFLTDYEGIGGHQNFRPGLTLIYLVGIHPRDGRLTALRMLPMKVRRFCMEHATNEDTEWLAGNLSCHGAEVRLAENHFLELRLQEIPERSAGGPAWLHSGPCSDAPPGRD